MKSAHLAYHMKNAIEVRDYFTHLDQQVNCLHCNSPLSPKQKEFCCLGCETVYKVIQTGGFQKYYEIKKTQNTFAKTKPVQLFNKNFNHFNDVEYLKSYSFASHNVDEISLRIYINGIHCLACLWILEQLPKHIAGLNFAKLNMGTQVLDIDWNTNFNISELLETIQSFGYSPQLIKADEDYSDFFKKERRSSLMKIGITGALTGNVMLMTTSVYTGASGENAILFHWISAFITFIIASYSAYEFHKNAWAGIFHKKQTNIDIPLSFAVLAGYGISLYNLLIGSEILYFDSIASLTFLILCSRYFLKYLNWKAVEKAIKYEKLLAQTAIRIINGIKENVPVEKIQVGDVIQVPVNHKIPVDSHLLSASAYIEQAVITGEEEILKKEKGDLLYAASENHSQDIVIKAVKSFNNSRVNTILQKVGKLEKAPVLEIADKLAWRFMTLSFGTAFLSFLYFYFQNSSQRGIETFLSIIIISCPCAFALAAPYVFKSSIQIASQLGIIIKSNLSLERLVKSKKIYLDKTGTLTDKNFRILNIEYYDDKSKIKNLLYSLEKQSSHPIGKSVVNHIQNAILLEFDHWQEKLGYGISAQYHGLQYSIKGIDHSEKINHNEKAQFIKAIGLFENNKLIAKVILASEYNRYAKHLIQELLILDIETHLLSGDREELVNKTANDLSINKFTAQSTPEEKLKIIEESENAIMLGDGANDSLALAKADVGIAVKGSMETAFQAADIYLQSDDLRKIPILLKLAKETQKLVKQNYLFSLIYNSFCIYLAIIGTLTPLWAAILMPISSSLLLINSHIGTKYMRKLKASTKENSFGDY